MAGTLSPFNMSQWVILPALANGCIPAFTVQLDGSGSSYYADAIKWPWDVCFTVLGGMPLFGDFDVCAEILSTGNLWDTVPPYSVPGTGTFAEIANGGSWENPDDHQVSESIQGVSAAFGYWFSKNTTRACQQATDAQFWTSVVSLIQSFADQQFANLPIPPAPTPPLPAWQRPPWNDPLAHAVQGGLGLLVAQASRLKGDIVNGRVVIGSVPIP